MFVCNNQTVIIVKRVWYFFLGIPLFFKDLILFLLFIKCWLFKAFRNIIFRGNVAEYCCIFLIMYLTSKIILSPYFHIYHLSYSLFKYKNWQIRRQVSVGVVDAPEPTIFFWKIPLHPLVFKICTQEISNASFKCKFGTHNFYFPTQPLQIDTF